MMFLVSSGKDATMYVRVQSFDTSIELRRKAIAFIVSNSAKNHTNRI